MFMPFCIIGKNGTGIRECCMNKGKSEALYFLKGLACLSVVIIHCTFPTKVGEMFTALCCYAVPVFYLTAGYYTYGASAEKIKSRIKKL